MLDADLAGCESTHNVSKHGDLSVMSDIFQPTDLSIRCSKILSLESLPYLQLFNIL